MSRFFIYVLFLGIVLRVNAQNNIELADAPTENKVGFFSKSFSYPIFLNGERHSNFVLGYNFDKKFMAELQGFYDSYLIGDALRLSLRGKYYFKDNFYLFSGMALDSGFDKYNGIRTPTRFYISNGMGYEMDEKISLDAKHEFQFNKTSLENYGMPSLFSVRGKYQF